MSVEGHASPFLQLALLGEAIANLDEGAVFLWDETARALSCRAADAPD